MTGRTWIAPLAIGVAAGAAVVGLAYGVHAWRDPGGRTALRARSVSPVDEKDAFKELANPGAYPPGKPGPLNRAVVDWTVPRVAVYTVPAATPPHRQASLLNLAERAQSHAIDWLGQGTAAAPHAWADLQKALDAADAPAQRDPFRFDRMLVATVSKGTEQEPGDRMMWTRVFVQPINFHFGAYTVAATENETVKLSSVEATSTRKFSADFGITLPGDAGPKASAGPSNEHTVKIDSDINTQYEKLGIDIMPDFLRIIRESETGGDAIGNSTVSLSILTDPQAIWRQFPGDTTTRPLSDDVVLEVTAQHLEDDGADLEASKASITVQPQAPIPHCPLRARIWMLYEQRHIETGREFYDEAQQTATLLRAADEKRDVEIVPADDVSPAVWSLRVLPAKQEYGGTETLLTAHVENGLPRPIVFTDYGMASKLAHWIRTHALAPVGHLTFDYAGDSSVVPVKKIVDECGRPS